MHRFFIPSSWIDAHAVTLSGDVARQLTRVLRVRPGDQIIVLDDSGFEYVVTLEATGPSEISGTVVERRQSQGEPVLKLNLYMALLKSDRFEFVLQKGTELGVSAFVPVVCAHSIQKAESVSAQRMERWRRIVREAAEQSGRGRLPSVGSPIEFTQACEDAEGLRLLPWEEEVEPSLKVALKRLGGAGTGLSVFIGPEGGLTQEEVASARSRGIVSVTLGRRTLRSETAAIASISAVMYELGELGQ